MENIVEKFKDSLTEIMTEHDISIVQLSAAININPSTLYRWFKDVRDIKLKTLIKLSDFFQCSPE